LLVSADFRQRECVVCKCQQLQVAPRAAELAAGRRPEKKCGLAAEKIAASRQPGRKKNAA